MGARLSAMLGFVWLSTMAAATLGVRACVEALPAEVAFSHKNHVQDRWLRLELNGADNPEVFRDCRGCHRFGPASPFSEPQRQCDECHFGNGRLVPQYLQEWQQDLAGYATRTAPAFRHHTHGMLECRECHLPTVRQKDSATGRVVPKPRDRMVDHLPIETGPGLCARCHDPSVTDATPARFRWFRGLADEALARAVGLVKPFAVPSDLAAYARKLHESFAGPAGGVNAPGQQLPPGGKFDHADHVDVVAPARGLACTVCHSGIPNATAAQVGTGQIPVEACAPCHVRDAAGAAARRAEQQKQVDRRLWTLGAFAHADHYRFLAPGAAKHDGVAGEAGYAAVKDQSCNACHTYAPEIVGFSREDFPFDADRSKHRYGDCIGCHDVAGWQTGESKAAPLHASTGGDGTGWQRCGGCHEPGEPDMKQRRPMVDGLSRFTGRTFVFPANTHPDITTRGVERTVAPPGGEGARAAIDCSECHRAAVPELDTRLSRRRFRHATHLAKGATQAACLECHPTAATAATPAALAGDDARTYTLQSCERCHWGGRVEEALMDGEGPAPRRVVAFPHAPHVKSAKLQRDGGTCAQCHAPAADGEDIVTRPEAAACNGCHNHVDDGPDDPEYEGLFGGAVSSCRKCHSAEVGGAAVASVPVPNSVRTAGQTVFAGFADAQFHPIDRACADCHKRIATGDADAPWLAIARPVGTNHLLVLHPVQVHDPIQGVPAVKVPECLQCHWTKVDGLVDQARGAPGTVAEKRARTEPDSPATRAAFGNLHADYPGRKSKG